MAYNEKDTLMANITAIDTAFRLVKEGRRPTPVERMQLQEYKGFGGVRSILRDPERVQTWPKYQQPLLPAVKLLFETLRQHIPEERQFRRVVDALKGSTNTAFYTPTDFIGKLGQTLAHIMGGVPGRMLEPSAGNGRFLSLFEGVEGSRDIQKVAFEKDIVTGTVLAALREDTEVHVDGFETISEADLGTFDMVVSNIPFGNIRVFDPAVSRAADRGRSMAAQSLHNYFFVKGLDAVRNGGLVVYLTSRGVAEADANRPVRQYLVEHANFISGIRLPDDLFEEEGIRQVGTDLLIFQRNDDKRELSEADKLFVETSDYQYRVQGNDILSTVIDLDKTVARNAWFNQEAGHNYLWETEEGEWMKYKHSLGIYRGDERDRYGNLQVYLGADEYWEKSWDEELESYLKRDFENHYDRVLAMKAGADNSRELLQNNREEQERLFEYPLYIPQEGEYTGHLREGALVMQQGMPGFIHREEVDGRMMDFFIRRRDLVEGETEYVRAYLDYRDTYYELKETEKEKQMPQPEIRAKLNRVFPVYWEFYKKFNGWQNDGERISISVSYDLREYGKELGNQWSYRPRKELEKDNTLTPYILSDIFSAPVDILPTVEISPAMQAQQQEIMSLYDLFGFSEEERTQIKTTGRKRNRTRTEQTGPAENIQPQAAEHWWPLPQQPRLLQTEGEDEDRIYLIENRYVHGQMMTANGQVGLMEFRDGQRWFVPQDDKFQPEEWEAVKAYISVRDTYWLLFDYERDTMVEREDLRERLNDRYDKLVNQFGGLREEKIASLVSLDPTYTTVAAMERYEDGERIKADIFSMPVSFRQEETFEELTPMEALGRSLNIKGVVDLQFIVNETGRSREEIIESLQGQIYYNPLERTWEEGPRILAGDVYEKIDEFRSIKENIIATARREEREMTREEIRETADIDDTLEALEKSKPVMIPFEELDFNLGERWIPEHLYEKFVDELFELKKPGQESTTKVKYIPGRDSYAIELGGWNYKTNQEWKIDASSYRQNLDAKDVLVCAMEDSVPEFVKQEWRNGKWVSVPDADTIQNCRAKMDAMRERFVDFLNAMPVAEKDALAELYNRRFNSSVRPHYDGSFQTFPGLSFEEFDYDELYPSQKDAIWMIKQNRGGICDHQVGAGKTMIMCVAAQEMKRLGLAHKPLIIALKANVHEIAATYRKAYPQAKILYPGKEDFKPANRERIFLDIQNNNYDCVILTHEQFGMIPQSLEVQREIMEQELADVEESLHVMEEVNGRWASGRMYTGMEKRKENLMVKIKELMSEINLRKDDTVDFRSMGIDHIFVDESHMFKNLMFQTRHQRVAGLGNTTGSRRSLNLFTAIRDIQMRTGRDLGATFLSGTTISNSLTELYVLFKYLRPQALEKQRITCFDAWAAVFTRKSTEFEFNVTNTIIQKERFRYFIKVPELAQFYNQITDYRTAEMIGIDRPQKNAVFRSIPPSEQQKEFIANLVEFARTGNGELIGRGQLSDSEMKGKMLIATNYSNKMALDLRLIDPFRFRQTEGGKVDVAADTIAQYYFKYNDVKGTQFVFSDLGTFKPGEWNVYSAIKDRLVEVHGLPENEIQFIQNNNTEKKRAKLISDMNEGKVRVVFGSTTMLGTGVNAQQRAVALHHLDTPWRPSDLEQREGRAIRKGNIVARDHAGGKVDIITYATERSLDAYKFNLLQNKQNFISQLKSRQIGSRTLDEGGMDEATGVNFAEYVAVLSGNTDLLDKAKLDKQISMLERERVLYNRDTLGMEREVDNIGRRIASMQHTIKDIQANMLVAQDKGMQFITRDGEQLAGSEVGRYIHAVRKHLMMGDEATVGEFAGMKVVAKQSYSVVAGGSVFTVSLRSAQSDKTYTVNNGTFPKAFTDGEPFFREILDGMPGRIDNLTGEIRKEEAKIPELQKLVEQRSWPKEDTLKELKQQAKDLAKRIEESLKKEERSEVAGDDVEVEDADVSVDRTDRREIHVAADMPSLKSEEEKPVEQQPYKLGRLSADVFAQREKILQNNPGSVVLVLTDDRKAYVLLKEDCRVGMDALGLQLQVGLREGGGMFQYTSFPKEKLLVMVEKLKQAGNRSVMMRMEGVREDIKYERARVSWSAAGIYCISAAFESKIHLAALSAEDYIALNTGNVSEKDIVRKYLVEGDYVTDEHSIEERISYFQKARENMTDEDIQRIKDYDNSIGGGMKR